METSKTAELHHREKSVWRPTLRYAFEEISAWWRRRRTARLLSELSAEQRLDYGIPESETNKPVFEVPRELMQRLMSTR
jgi:uncharacterized protein YjiS (DUF1127 family)